MTTPSGQTYVQPIGIVNYVIGEAGSVDFTANQMIFTFDPAFAGDVWFFNTGYTEQVTTVDLVTGINTFSGEPFHGFHIEDTHGVLSDIVNVTLAPGSALGVPFDEGTPFIDIAHDANNIWLDFQGLSFARGSQVIFDVVFA
jgi:hypothetical protein